VLSSRERRVSEESERHDANYAQDRHRPGPYLRHRYGRHDKQRTTPLTFIVAGWISVWVVIAGAVLPQGPCKVLFARPDLRLWRSAA
jgi:hypothetical protein